MRFDGTECCTNAWEERSSIWPLVTLATEDSSLEADLFLPFGMLAWSGADQSGARESEHPEIQPRQICITTCGGAVPPSRCSSRPSKEYNTIICRDCYDETMMRPHVASGVPPPPRPQSHPNLIPILVIWQADELKAKLSKLRAVARKEQRAIRMQLPNQSFGHALEGVAESDGGTEAAEVAELQLMISSGLQSARR